MTKDGLLALFDAGSAKVRDATTSELMLLRSNLVAALDVAQPPPVVPPPVPPAVPWGPDPAGWKLNIATDFATPVALGSWSVYDRFVDAYPWLRVYSDGWPDSNGKPVDQGGRGGTSRYMPSKVLEVRDGQLVMNLFNDGAGERSATFRVGPDQTSGRYAISFTADPIIGFKTAFLLWPDVDSKWPAFGEIDFPEGSLSETIGGYMHRQGATWGGDQDSVATNARHGIKHTAVTEWEAGKRVAYWLDGVKIGEWFNRVPTGPMHWCVQVEANIGGVRAPVGTKGQVKIDWLASWTKT